MEKKDAEKIIFIKDFLEKEGAEVFPPKQPADEMEVRRV